jgi:AraC-like DNA-binding protein
VSGKEVKSLIAHLDGDYETVDYMGDRSILIYDNVETEEYPLHWHNAIEIIMPLTNSFETVCDGVSYLLSERDVLIIPAGTLHQMKAQPGRRLFFQLDNRTIADNPALTDLSSLLAAPLLINAEYDRDLLSSLNSTLKDIYILYSEFEDLAEVRIYLNFINMLTRIREHQLSTADIEEDGKYSDKFRNILKYIDMNYMNDITLDDLADMAGYSKYHFSRIFKKYCNTTFIAFLNQRRIKAAEMLLLNEEMSVTNVAMQVGFSSLTTFNRVFKELKGGTPSEFRRLYRPPKNN